MLAGNRMENRSVRFSSPLAMGQASAVVPLPSRFLGECTIRGLDGNTTDPARQRLKPGGCLQLRSLGLTEPDSYDPPRWGVGIACWSTSGHVPIVSCPRF